MNAGNAYAYAGNSPWNYEDPLGLFTRFSSWDTIDEIIDPNSRMPIPSRLGGAYALYAGQSEFAAELGTVVNASYCIATSEPARDLAGMLFAPVNWISAGLHFSNGEYGQGLLSTFEGIPGLGSTAKGAKYGAYGFAAIYGGIKRIDDARELEAWLQKSKQLKDVYLGVKGNVDQYAGISNDVARRLREHKIFDTLRQLSDQPLLRNQARAIEQALISANPQFLNRFNSISNRRAIFGPAVEWGRRWLIENGFGNLL